VLVSEWQLGQSKVKLFSLLSFGLPFICSTSSTERFEKGFTLSKPQLEHELLNFINKYFLMKFEISSPLLFEPLTIPFFQLLMKV
jgi:hypothetical protein